MHRDLLRQMWRSWRARRRGEWRMSARRLRVMAMFAFIAPLQLGLTRLFLLLDHLFFPSFRKTPVRQPVFVVGNFRSGTTAMLEGLSLASRDLLPMKTWEIYVAPSICQRKLISIGALIDSALGGPIRRIVQSVDRGLLADVRYHRVGLNLPEEDEGLFLYRWAGLFSWFFFPADTSPLAYADFRQLGPYRRRSLMKYYRRMIQRHLYVHGAQFIQVAESGSGAHPIADTPRYLSKNPSATGRIADLASEFPDARFVYMVRKPATLVPSMVNWLCYATSFFQPEDQPYRHRDVVLSLAEAWYAEGRNLPDATLLVRAEDLAGDPVGGVLKALRELQSPVQPNARALLTLEPAQPNDYSPESVGLNPDKLNARLRWVGDYFGYGNSVISPAPIASPAEDA